jgi:hypothetical protein
MLASGAALKGVSDTWPRVVLLVNSTQVRGACWYVERLDGTELERRLGADRWAHCCTDGFAD